jgi:hypothetical protein
MTVTGTNRRNARRRGRAAPASAIAVALAAIAPAEAQAAPNVYGGEAGNGRGAFALQVEPADAIDVGLIAFDLSVSCPGYSRSLDISDALPLVSPRIRAQVNSLYSGPPSAEGDWDASGYVSYSLGRYDLEIDETVTGKLTATEAAGTFRAKARLYRRRTGKLAFKCRTARHAWRARAAPGRVFAGATSGERPVVIELADDGLSIRRIHVAGWARCGGNLGSPSESKWNDLPLDAGATFDVSTPYAYRQNRIRYRGRQAIGGGVLGTVVRGTFSDRWTERHPDGSKQTCKTGNLRYRALSSPIP